MSEKKVSLGRKLRLDMSRNYQVYLMALPAVILLFVFAYVPMYGITIAFTKYRPYLGFLGSEWVGLKHFTDFFASVFAWRLIRNTLLLSVYSFIFGFPLPIILALTLNEVRNRYFKRITQTISYMPYFISTVVICGMMREFFSYEGVITQIFSLVTGSAPTNLLGDPANFRTIFVVSSLWQHMGWDSIIFLAALANVDQQLYDSAKIDGAGRLKQLQHVTLPGITPTIIILMILSVGSLLAINDSKILLLYSPMTYETADVIGTYVYRRGIRQSDYSFATAVGLMNTVVNFLLLIFANWFSRKTAEHSLW
jgi:putative aldouronate transport system permease protein